MSQVCTKRYQIHPDPGADHLKPTPPRSNNLFTTMLRTDFRPGQKVKPIHLKKQHVATQQSKCFLSVSCVRGYSGRLSCEQTDKCLAAGLGAAVGHLDRLIASLVFKNHWSLSPSALCRIHTPHLINHMSMKPTDELQEQHGISVTQGRCEEELVDISV